MYRKTRWGGVTYVKPFLVEEMVNFVINKCTHLIKDT